MSALSCQKVKTEAEMAFDLYRSHHLPSGETLPLLDLLQLLTLSLKPHHWCFPAKQLTLDAIMSENGKWWNLESCRLP